MKKINRLLSVGICAVILIALTGCMATKKVEPSKSPKTAAKEVEANTEISTKKAEAQTESSAKEDEEKTESDSEEDEGKNELSDESEVVETDVNVSEKLIESTPEEALEFAKNLKAGWNLGNTLDSFIEGQHNQINSEVCWGNPKTTKEMFGLVKEVGFSTVRIPVSWHNHAQISEDGNHLIIDREWLDRVKEVVDYGIDSGLYVIINIHHDNEPEGKYGYIPDYANKDQALWYVTEVWTQVATYFKDYDEHLIFESLNEPRLTNDPTHEWWFDKNDSHCLEAADVINEMNQKVVDIVRASGGNNVNRYVCVPGYCAQIAAENTEFFVLPEDPASYKLMVAYHAYVPYDFALNPDMSFDTFDKNAAAIEINYNIDIAKKFMKKGIPVVLGEYGAREKNGNISERVAYYDFYVKKCADAGIPSIVWDNGAFTGSGERFGLMDRNNLSFKYPEIINAIVGAYE